MEITPELLKKLKALAENPGATEGERNVALSKMRSLAEQAGIDLSTLTEEEKEEVFFFRTGKLRAHEITLAVQLLGVATNKKRVSLKYIRRGPYARHVGYKATASQAIEFQMLFPYYLKAFRDSLDDYILAFIHRNDLFSDDARGFEKLPSKKDLERIMRMMKMAAGIEPIPRPLKQLASGGQ